jgi:hypothetical protein
MNSQLIAANLLQARRAVSIWQGLADTNLLLDSHNPSIYQVKQVGTITTYVLTQNNYQVVN